MKSLDWRTTQLGERVFTHHVKGAALHSATVIGCTGRRRVRILFDHNRSEAWRAYDECFPIGEITMYLKTGQMRATAELQASAKTAAA